MNLRWSENNKRRGAAEAAASAKQKGGVRGWFAVPSSCCILRYTPIKTRSRSVPRSSDLGLG